MSNWFITGIGGMDGSHLCDWLLDKGENILGLIRRTSTDNTQRIKHVLDHSNLTLIEGDITDSGCINNIFQDNKIDFCVNLGAQSHVQTSFDVPAFTFDVNTKGVLYLLETIRLFSPRTRFLTASSSEQWGNNYSVDKNGEKYQDLNTPWAPRSPYGVSKLASYELVRVYRESYNLFACCSVCHNHDGPRRGSLFVSRKITLWLASYQQWKKEQNDFTLVFDDEDYIFCRNGNRFAKLRLGNIYSKRDFGFSIDYIRAMYLMLKNNKPKDYVVSTDVAHSVKEFLGEAFNYVLNDDYKQYIIIDKAFFRPSEVDYLRGKSNELRKDLGWAPTIDFKSLVRLMCDSDIEALNEKETPNRQEKIPEKV